MRRRYRWAEIAAQARSTPGVWRQHPDLIAVTEHTLRHAQRRVRALRDQPDGTFTFRRGHQGTTQLGVVILDVETRFTPRGSSTMMTTNKERRRG